MTKPLKPAATAVDLFCGAGGLTRGLLDAGINVVAGYDTDEQCRFPYEHNNPGVKFHDNSVTKITARDLARQYPKGHARILVGCAPCQTFSKYTQGLNKFLEKFRKTILRVVEDWDKWRIKHREEGDPDNERLSKKERASLGLFGAVSKEYDLSKSSANKGKVAGWVDGLSEDAAFNFESYADCFVSENVVRRYIKDKKMPLSPEAQAEAERWKKTEIDNKGKGNISITIRRGSTDSSYLSMDFLANLVDKPTDPLKEAALARDAKEYKPIRDAVAHTALLTDAAKSKLSSVRENIKQRVKTIVGKTK
jgi:hypothetical protein